MQSKETRHVFVAYTVLLKAGASATGMILLIWAGLTTPVGVLFVVLFGVFIAQPLDSLGLVDLGKSSNGFFVPNLTAVALTAVPSWLFFFWIFLVLFKASDKRKAIGLSDGEPK